MNITRYVWIILVWWATVCVAQSSIYSTITRYDPDAVTISSQLQEYASSPISSGEPWSAYEYAMAALILDYANDPNSYDEKSVLDLSTNAASAVAFITQLSWADRIYQEAAFLVTASATDLNSFSYSSYTSTSTIGGSSTTTAGGAYNFPYDRKSGFFSTLLAFLVMMVA
ncbi:hypothetical protein CANARDRAFT_20558 [[Candida] arabinofermentans NRRL YB-2248]|uniref:Uncharacterized protein n=1 Tax=[Candida] arabinofermentans NRRL YB-2248 TaxID=983967 RepID=A0A1E4T7T2_9ASCO|nr:hypothetical protein CANARDRAFT_20558 [[Candida] arabinofermentans NRRL YB-2248]